ncbi:galactokinase [Thoreauomyces humboldtii]|nr:galactokinase [Thoreauomyces humboldtii]
MAAPNAAAAAIPLAEEFPPSTCALEDVYQPEVLAFQKQRYAKLTAAFVARFGANPDFYARSPGRVNLIGEHIDYCGFSVLPMAIDRDFVIAVKVVPTEASSAAKVSLANTDSRFPERSFEHEYEGHVTIDASLHEWSNYFKCGYKGVFEQVALGESGAGPVPVSFHAMVDGTVPPGAGVSSSSAFVCCSALATLHANGGALKKGSLITAAVKGEQHAGVSCGGMDQSISIMAPVGSPLIIHFTPSLSADRIVFPRSEDSPVFVIANTLVVAEKHVTAPIHYNLRVVETRLAAAILNKHMGGPAPASGSPLLTLRDLQDLYLKTHGGEFAGNEQKVLQALATLVDAGLPNRTGYTREEAAAALDVSVADLEARYVGSITIRADTFQLHGRAKHVFEEASRVFQFRDVCEKKAPYTGNLLEDLGRLMDASQTSCRELFDCSCPEIDELATIARRSGALGSRLTGAGWGGCTVSLVAEKDVPAFIATVKEQYYYKRWPQWRGDADAEKKLEDVIFASKPGGGAAVVTKF